MLSFGFKYFLNLKKSLVLCTIFNYDLFLNIKVYKKNSYLNADFRTYFKYLKVVILLQ